MFDTLNIWIPREAIGDTPDHAYSEYQRLINEMDTIKKNIKGNDVYRFNLDNFAVLIFDEGISIKGSLAKYHFGNNFETLNINSAYRAVKRLEFDLKVPVLKAEVRRIDFSTNFILPEIPNYYYGYLLDAPRTKRELKNTSLYFTNKSKQLLFYDKIEWAKKENPDIPISWVGKNILRYEYRFFRDSIKKLSSKKVLLGDLIKPDIYIQILDKWQTEYFKIQKKKEFIIDYYSINKPKDFFDMLLAESLKQKDYHEHIDLLEQMKVRKVFKNRSDYTRVKKRLTKHYVQGYATTTKNPLEPLNQAVLNHYSNELKSIESE